MSAPEKLVVACYILAAGLTLIAMVLEDAKLLWAALGCVSLGLFVWILI